VKGELFVEPLTDHPDSTFVPEVELRVAGPDEREPDPNLPSLRVESSRPYKAGYLVAFGGVTDRSAAGLLRHRILLRPAEEVSDLEEDELFHFELVGMTVVTAGGERVGAVVEVFEARPADLLEVRRPGGTVLIPFSRSLVTGVDRDEGTITIEPPEGLLEL